MISEHDHLARIVDLARSIEDDLEVIPFSLPARIEQTQKQIAWLHELQEHTLACIEESYMTIHGLRRLMGMGDEPA